VQHVLSLLAVAAIVVPGVVSGFWSGRWSFSNEPQASAARLDRLQVNLEGWDQDLSSLGPRAIAQANLSGVWTCRFTNLSKTEAFSIFIGCGLPGPVSVHGPEACYPGAGFRMMESPKKVAFEFPGALPAGEFLTCRFEKPGPAGDNRIQIYWSWCADGKWQIPANPRLAFGGKSVLHKLYVVQAISPDGSQAEKEKREKRAAKFIEALIPQIHRALFTKSSDG
jgi:hypothetical protein